MLTPRPAPKHMGLVSRVAECDSATCPTCSFPKRGAESDLSSATKWLVLRTPLESAARGSAGVGCAWTVCISPPGPGPLRDCPWAKPGYFSPICRGRGCPGSVMTDGIAGPLPEDGVSLPEREDGCWRLMCPFPRSATGAQGAGGAASSHDSQVQAHTITQLREPGRAGQVCVGRRSARAPESRPCTRATFFFF